MAPHSALSWIFNLIKFTKYFSNSKEVLKTGEVLWFMSLKFLTESSWWWGWLVVDCDQCVWMMNSVHSVLDTVGHWTPQLHSAPLWPLHQCLLARHSAINTEAAHHQPPPHQPLEPVPCRVCWRREWRQSWWSLQLSLPLTLTTDSALTGDELHNLNQIWSTLLK